MNDYTDYVYFVLGGMKDENEKVAGIVLAAACMVSLEAVVLQRKKK